MCGLNEAKLGEKPANDRWLPPTAPATPAPPCSEGERWGELEGRNSGERAGGERSREEVSPSLSSEAESLRRRFIFFSSEPIEDDEPPDRRAECGSDCSRSDSERLSGTSGDGDGDRRKDMAALDEEETARLAAPLANEK